MNSPKSPSRAAAHRGNVVRWPVPEAARAGTPRRWLARLLPAMLAGVSDADPALVVTATVAGAMYRYSLLWTVLLCFPFLFSVFAVSSRIGFETRKGLVDLLRSHYGRAAAFACALIVVAINLAMIVADLMAVTEAFSIVLELPRMFFIGVVAFSVWYIVMFRDYRKITAILALLSLPLFLYVAAAVLAHPGWSEVAGSSLAPRIPRGLGYPAAMVAILGSLLTPYVLVWQTSSGREEARDRRRQGSRAKHRAGALVTTMLCYAVMVAAGTLLHVDRVDDLTTRMAALALAPATGSLANLFFALGILGSGMVALPVLVASLCYSVAEAMQWRRGLDENPWDAVLFYVLISAAMFLATALNFIKFNAVTALYWSQILAGALAVPILAFILLVSNNPRIMRTTNNWRQNFWLGAAAGAVLSALLIVLWRKLAG